jgi:hypothetical protein
MVCCAATGSPSSKRSVKLFFQSFILFFSTEKETFVRTGLEKDFCKEFDIIENSLIF